jgi:hypothetical protein
LKGVSRISTRVFGSLVRNRSELPRFVNRLIDDVAKNPDGFAGRLASLILGGSSRSQIPPATAAPTTPTRVYIGPTNYSGQGYLWARALEASSDGIGARNMAVELPGGFSFAANSLVPIAVYNSSAVWQRAELEAVSGFTHVLFEAERPLFGRLFRRDVAAENAELLNRGLSTAFLCHGTDIRSPRRSMELTPWSPFADDPEIAAGFQKDADRNIAMLEQANRPVFVSTPDLLLDVPTAHWCPIVVDAEIWRGGRSLLSRRLPVVAHIPSMGLAKGTHLIDGTLTELHDAGLIEYRRESGVASARMPELVGDADIVLDQFRVGSYGVAACEAMAAGRVVVGHVLPQVRQHVFNATGLKLPIVEATPDTIAEALRSVLSDEGSFRHYGEEGARFVDEVHSGARSAATLSKEWISRS